MGGGGGGGHSALPSFQTPQGHCGSYVACIPRASSFLYMITLTGTKDNNDGLFLGHGHSAEVIKLDVLCLAPLPGPIDCMQQLINTHLKRGEGGSIFITHPKVSGVCVN